MALILRVTAALRPGGLAYVQVVICYDRGMKKLLDLHKDEWNRFLIGNDLEENSPLLEALRSAKPGLSDNEIFESLLPTFRSNCE